MGHHILMQVLLGLIFSTLIENGRCRRFSSFQEVDLDEDNYPDSIDRSDHFFEDDDIKLEDQESYENVVDAAYKYQFNVIDEEEQVYQHQKQQREKGVRKYLG